jgi:hypothetical protein
MTRVTKVISGGQTGVDQAALRAAHASGLECGGWAPPGRACESGIIPLRFPMTETPEERSAEAPEVARSLRTEWNVRDSDATLVLRNKLTDGDDPGTRWAVKCAARYQKPLRISDPSEVDALLGVLEWLATYKIATLNVAGPSEGTQPGIGDLAQALLIQVFAAQSGSSSSRR